MQLTQVMEKFHAIFMSGKSFRDRNSNSLFTFMAGCPLEFVIQTFQLERTKDFAVNISALVILMIYETKNNIQSNENVLQFVTDSPDLVQETRKRLCVFKSGGSNCCVFHNTEHLVILS